MIDPESGLFRVIRESSVLLGSIAYNQRLDSATTDGEVSFIVMVTTALQRHIAALLLAHFSTQAAPCIALKAGPGFSFGTAHTRDCPFAC